jgi:MFS family permease
VSGSFFTRLGIGGVPFLLPLLYQVGLGFTPIESGLLIMPQAIAAMSIKVVMPRLLTRIGYRGVLISNTVVIGLLLLLFATIGLDTRVWVIVLLAFLYGGFTSLQYTSMNTLVYADIMEDETSNASSIASTMQQMSISFGVASAGLATTFFIPSRLHSNPQEMIQGIHEALIVLRLSWHCLNPAPHLLSPEFWRLPWGGGPATKDDTQRLRRRHTRVRVFIGSSFCVRSRELPNRIPAGNPTHTAYTLA